MSAAEDTRVTADFTSNGYNNISFSYENVHNQNDTVAQNVNATIDDIPMNHTANSVDYENEHARYEKLALERGLGSSVRYEKYGVNPAGYETLDVMTRQHEGDYKTCETASIGYVTLTQNDTRDDVRQYDTLNKSQNKDRFGRKRTRLYALIAVILFIVVAGGVATALYFSLSENEVDGGLTTWSTWSSCTATCSGGIQVRTRNCSNPTPKNGGADCNRSRYEEKECNNNSCPINGGFTLWSAWTACTVTCDGGTQTRSRSCENPTPAYGGLDCDGVSFEQQTCNNSSCSGIESVCWTGKECANCDQRYVGSVNGVSVCCQKCEKSGLSLGPGYCYCLHNGP